MRQRSRQRQLARQLGIVLLVALALVLVAALVGPITDLIAKHDLAAGSHLLAARETVRTQLLTLGAGVFAAGALWFTARNYVLSREGQVTDRYSTAIEQLGSDKLDVRIGGIYALERIARDSARDHPIVMEVLSAFIREHSYKQEPSPEPDAPTPERPVQPDVHAAVTVIGRRDASQDLRVCNLAKSHLVGADLVGANLRGMYLSLANLDYAHLSRADLSHADFLSALLRHSDLAGADLTYANLMGAHFSGADLRGADLRFARLELADLGGANLSFAKLGGAYLRNADLRFARLELADLGAANFGGARLGGATWPSDTAVPDGWLRDDNSGQLKPAGADLSNPSN